jgi:hypothetical protein
MPYWYPKKNSATAKSKSGICFMVVLVKWFSNEFFGVLDDVVVDCLSVFVSEVNGFEVVGICV